VKISGLRGQEFEIQVAVAVMLGWTVQYLSEAWPKYLYDVSWVILEVAWILYIPRIYIELRAHPTAQVYCPILCDE
jgi:hypothetical protein